MDREKPIYCLKKHLRVPRGRQPSGHTCGVQALESVLAYYGCKGVRKDRLVDCTGADANGTSIIGIEKTILHYGLRYDSRSMTIADVIRYIDNDIPVILALQAWSKVEGIDYSDVWDEGHYAVAIGYDDSVMAFQDPSDHNITYLSFEELLKRWHDKGIDGSVYTSWGIAVFGRKPRYKPHVMVPMG